MNSREESLLRGRISLLKREVSRQMSLPKHERDASYIDGCQKAINKIRAWLGEKVMPKERVMVQKNQVTKKEFAEKFKEAVGAPQDPSAVVRIENIDQIEENWPVIMSGQVMIEAPKDVKEEIRNRIRRNVKNMHIKGFRA